MKPTFLIHRAEGGGTLRLERVEGDLLRIGRATHCELRLGGDAGVDLEHALIRRDGGLFLLVDSKSVTGTYLNGRPIESERLAPGDRIAIGGYQLEVRQAEAGMLGLEVDRRTAPEPGAVELATRELAYSELLGLARPGLFNLPGLSLGALGAAALVALLFLAATAAGRSTALAPGALAGGHATTGLGPRCDSCHAPFRGPASSRCQHCHPGAPHQARQVAAPACGGCHTEHRRLTRLAEVPDGRCTTCHGRLEVAGGGQPAVAVSIRAFADHPKFRLGSAPVPLAFSHEYHLRPGLLGPGQVPTPLDCASCHGLEDKSGQILPVRFEDHCQRCHNLSFSAPGRGDLEAPHGDSQAASAAVLQAVARDPALLSALSAGGGRSLIFGRTGGGLSLDQATRQQAGVLVEQLFRNHCAQCHQVELRGMLDATVAPVVLPSSFMPSVRFSHGSHQVAGVACRDCHAGAATSRKAEDLLIPGRDACLPCHAGPAAGRLRPATGCVTCHTYHGAKPSPAAQPAGGGGPAHES